MYVNFFHRGIKGSSVCKAKVVCSKEKDIDTQGNNRKHMFEELKKTVPNGCCTSFYARDYETDVSSEVPVASNANLLTKVAATCKSVEEFLSQMPVPTVVQVQQIETETRGQADNAMWANQRKGRITASNFYYGFTRVLPANRSINHSVEPLLRKIMGYDASKGHNIPALNHGKEYEPIAKEKYIPLMKCNHKEFAFSESGLFVDPSRPYLEASLDLLVYCSGCGMGLSEMKIHFSIVNEILSAKNLPYLVEHDNVTMLRKEHAYYAQIEGQLALCGRTYCDFFVFTRVGSLCSEFILIRVIGVS